MKRSVAIIADQQPSTQVADSIGTLVSDQRPQPGIGRNLDNIDMVQVMRRCLEMALAGIHREFPCQFPLVLGGPTIFSRPRELTPAFYGCYDWHSAVHSHWLLVRWLAFAPASEPRLADVRSALAANLSAENLAREYQFLSHPLRISFERPYGLAWLLELTAELRHCTDPIAATILPHIEPLEQLVASRFRDWLPKLRAPVRTGEHGQTAFALGLVADWARDVGDMAMIELVRDTATRFYLQDRDLPLTQEPAGHDFLSPSLATTDLMRRMLDSERFGEWLTVALPGFPRDAALQPVPAPVDMKDGKLAHLVGLNFSRAWMLDGICAGLPHSDARRDGLDKLARDHLTMGIPMLDCDEYAVTHWVGTFAMYAVTQCGMSR